MIIMGKYGSTSQVFAIFAAIAAIYFIMNYSLSVAGRLQQSRLTARSY